MTKVSSQLFPALIVVAVLAMMHVVCAHAEQSFDYRVAEAAKRLGELYRKGVNVTDVVRLLDNAVKAFEDGNYSEASRLLNASLNRIAELEAVADRIYMFNLFTKALIIAILAAIPLLIYIFLPRLYLYLWFRSRRRWVVRR
jgi:hypothetical protein